MPAFANYANWILKSGTHRLDPTAIRRHGLTHYFTADGGKNPTHPLYGWVLIQVDMKQYVIDELRLEDHNKIKAYLEETYGAAEMGAIYWVPVATDMLTAIQREHTDCQPYYFAIELDESRFALELLIRTKSRVRCACIGYASKDQRIWIMEAVDAIFERLNIAT